MRDLNKNVDLRDEILKPYSNGQPHFYYFEKVPFEVLCRLKDLGFLDVDDCQNDAPSIGVFLEHMKSGLFTAHGYAVGIDRSDYRISIEGLESDKGVVFDHVQEFRTADEFTLESNYFRCWWD